MKRTMFSYNYPFLCLVEFSGGLVGVTMPEIAAGLKPKHAILQLVPWNPWGSFIRILHFLPLPSLSPCLAERISRSTDFPTAW